jgi:hypothetical protein
LTAIAIIAATAHAQNQDGGLQADLSIAQRLTWSDNPDFAANGQSDLRSLTSLSFALASVTRTETFRFTLGGTVEAGGNDVFQPFSTLLYSRESAATKLDLDFSYRQSDVSDFTTLVDPDDDDPDPDRLSLDGGQRQDFQGRVAIEFGRDAPFGASLSYEKRIRDFVDTADPNLFDSETDAVSARFRFDLTPQATLTAFAEDRREDEDPGGTDRETSRYGLEVAFALSQSLDATFSLSQDEVVTTVGAAPTVRNDGLSYSAGLTQALPNGALSADLTARVNENGRRNQLTFRREVDLRNGGFSFSLGAVRFPTGQTRGLFGLTYSTDFDRTQIRASLFQVPSVTDTVETLNTRVSVSLEQALTPLSRFSTNLNFTDIDSISAAGQDSNRLDVDLSYSHDVGSDWKFTGGLRHRRQESSTAADVTSNSIFFGLSKNLSWRP